MLLNRRGNRLLQFCNLKFGIGAIRQTERESTAYTQLRLDIDISPKAFGYTLADGESQAGTLHKIVQLLETIENQRYLILRHAAARVADKQVEPTVPLHGTQRNTSMLGILNGIGQKIEQHLSQPVAVSQNPDRPCRRNDFQFNPGRHFQAVHLAHLVEQPGHLDRLEMVLGFARLDPGKVENIVDQLQ